MKKMMSILSSGILGTLLMLGTQNAEAAPHHRYQNTRIVHQKVVQRTVVRPVTTLVRTIHRVHIPVRHSIRYITTYTLQPHLSRWAYRTLNHTYNGNVQLFCQANPGLCIASTQRIVYSY